MTPHRDTPHPLDDADPRSVDDRTALDEALFGGFAPLIDPSPIPLVPATPPEPPPQVVIEHVVPPELTAPTGYYDPPAAAPEPAEEEPPAPERPREPLALAVNAGLTITAGDTATITAAHLHVTGDDPFLIDLMVLSPPEHGALLRDGFALTGGDVFTQEDIDRGRLRYRHDGGAPVTDGFTFATPDEQVPATVFAITDELARRAPELTGDGQLATPLDGCRIADVLDGAALCCDPDQPPGIALVGVMGRGVWQYTLDGSDWLDLGEIHHGSALLLRETDAIRFVPRRGWSGTAKLIYRAWDQTSGQAGDLADLAGRGQVGGTTAFSKVVASAAATVAPAALDLGGAEPWVGEPTLADLAGEALAILRLAGEGRWQFSLDEGRTWLDFGAVYHGRARLLRGGDRVRFLPRPGASGKVLLSGRPWDGRGGSPGGTANLAASRSYGDGTPFGEFVLTRTWWLA